MSVELTSAAREERVLTLLHLLGADAAEQVLTRLDPQAATTLRNRLQSFKDRLPGVKKQRQVLEEFERFFKFAKTTAKPNLKLHAPGEDEDDEPEVPEEPVYRLSGDPLIDLEKMNRYQLSAALNEEQPRTVALLLKVVSARRVAQLLDLLEESHREATVQELGRDPRAPEVILRKIAATTVERATALPAKPPKKDDPVQRMVEVLRATDKAKRRQILKALEQQDPEQAALINKSLYRFDDLATLEDSQVQKVLSRVDSATLSTALFGAEEKILNKIMNNLSKRARASLQEELTFRRNVPGNQLQVAREQVVQAISEAEQEAE